MTPDFQPTLLGTPVSFQNEEGEGMITNETPTEIFIQSPFFTGWMNKAEFYALLGTED